MVSKFLQLMRPFMSITPEVVKPAKEVHFNQKLIWTAAALIIYFVMSSTPLVGVDANVADPFAFMRTITASTKGSLAELGIGPIVTAGLIMQILSGSEIIKVNMGDPEERSLYTGAQKVMSVGMTLIEAVAFIIGGAYGTNLNLAEQLAIMGQLVAAGVIIILMDEMVQKGWGLGSGISLFIAGGVALTIFSSLFHFYPFPEASIISNRGLFFAIISLVSGLGVIEGLQVVFFRYNPALNVNLPDHSLVAFLATIVVFIIVIYFESMRIEIPVSFAQHKGTRSNYPIKLLYVSNIPVILTSAVFADVYLIAQLIWNGDPNGLLATILGKFEQVGDQVVPRSGLVYFLTPPRSLIGDFGVITPTGNPIESVARALIYAAILIVLSVFFSVIWLETAAMGPSHVANQLIQSGMQMPGWRRHKKIVERRLEMYIPTVAVMGGIFIGSLAAFADFLGAMGSGMGILLSVSIMRQYFELISKERVAEMNPAFRGFLGL